MSLRAPYSMHLFVGWYWRHPEPAWYEIRPIDQERVLNSSVRRHSQGCRDSLTQQHSRIGACAQAAIWMAARHFQSRHRGSVWASTVDITEGASKPTDHLLSLSVPAGSRGLTVEHMVRVLRSLGREPLLYHGNYDAATKTTKWPAAIRPIAVVDRYVNSGIPVIIGLSPWVAGQDDFHAVLAVGHTIQKIDLAKVLPAKPTRVKYARFLLINDDQRGTNLRMELSASDALSETPYNQSNIVYLIVPFPAKFSLQLNQLRPSLGICSLSTERSFQISKPHMRSSSGCLKQRPTNSWRGLTQMK